MGVTLAATATVAALLVWHLRIRRHPSWLVSSDGRFYILCGYPMVALAVYWLMGSPTSTGWEWAVGNAWALVAMVSLVYGCNALNAASRQQQATAQTIESLPRGAGHLAPNTQN